MGLGGEGATATVQVVAKNARNGNASCPGRGNSTGWLAGGPIAAAIGRKAAVTVGSWNRRGEDAAAGGSTANAGGWMAGWGWRGTSGRLIYRGQSSVWGWHSSGERNATQPGRCREVVGPALHKLPAAVGGVWLLCFVTESRGEEEGKWSSVMDDG